MHVKIECGFEILRFGHFWAYMTQWMLGMTAGFIKINKCIAWFCCSFTSFCYSYEKWMVKFLPIVFKSLAKICKGTAKTKANFVIPWKNRVILPIVTKNSKEIFKMRGGDMINWGIRELDMWWID